jgi:DNA-binding XRE family transcriptional regulator
MPKPHPDAEELRERSRRAKEWKQFRREYLFSQRLLAEILQVSPRTIQNIEAGTHTCLSATQRRFVAHRAKFLGRDKVA